MWQLCTQMRCPSYLQLHFMALLVKSLSATSKLGLITTCGALSVRVAAPCPTTWQRCSPVPGQLCLPGLGGAAACAQHPHPWQDLSPQLLEGSEELVAAVVVGWPCHCGPRAHKQRCSEEENPG